MNILAPNQPSIESTKPPRYAPCQRSGKDGRAFKSWQCMIQRCTNPKTDGYHYYGGRGIRVCERWLAKGGFINFLADMGSRPEGVTLDRINCDGDYEPSNCRWATPLDQMRNRRPFFSNEKKTHCPKGHPYIGYNVISKKESDGRPKRQCRQCKNDQAKARRDKYREITGHSMPRSKP